MRRLLIPSAHRHRDYLLAANQTDNSADYRVRQTRIYRSFILPQRQPWLGAILEILPIDRPSSPAVVKMQIEPVPSD